MNFNNPIIGMLEGSRDYILDITAEDGVNTAIGPYQGNIKISIILGKTAPGSVFTFSPTVLKEVYKNGI